MPDWLLVLMPGRVLNVDIFLVSPLLLGLMSTVRPAIVGDAMTVALSAGLLICADYADAVVVLILASVSLMLYCAITLRRDGQRLVESTYQVPASGPTQLRRISLALRAALVVIVGTGVGIAVSDAKNFAKSADLTDRLANRPTVDWRTDPLYQAAARGSDLLLTGESLWLVQLRTRRPILLDVDTLDTLPYALEAAPAVEDILLRVYGIDLFQPPESWELLYDANRAVWEARSVADWQQIGREYGISQILTPTGWKLNLPTVAQDSAILYAIPK